MIVNIKDSDPPVLAEKVGGNGSGIEIAESSEGAMFCMMAGRSDKSILRAAFLSL